jgi:hypothetical protein
MQSPTLHPPSPPHASSATTTTSSSASTTSTSTAAPYTSLSSSCSGTDDDYLATLARSCCACLSVMGAAERAPSRVKARPEVGDLCVTVACMERCLANLMTDLLPPGAAQATTASQTSLQSLLKQARVQANPKMTRSLLQGGLATLLYFIALELEEATAILADLKRSNFRLRETEFIATSALLAALAARTVVNRFSVRSLLTTVAVTGFAWRRHCSSPLHRLRSCCMQLMTYLRLWILVNTVQKQNNLSEQMQMELSEVGGGGGDHNHAHERKMGGRGSSATLSKLRSRGMSQAKSYLSLHMKEAAADVDPDKMLASRKIMEQVPPNSSLAPWLQRIPFLQVRVALAVG